MYNILVVGNGYVGSAIVNSFKKNKIFIADPKLKTNIQNFKDKKLDFIFVCVDTPKNEKFKILYNVLKELNFTFTKTIIICKSTALPDFYKKCIDKFTNNSIVYYPEYLSHWNNLNDFENQTFSILGGNIKACKKVEQLLKRNLKNLKKVVFTDIETAAFIKYAENCFLSLKVTFANEMNCIIKKIKLPSSYEKFSELLCLDARIGKSHLKVPGRDGKYGWGGHCFEKDTYEFAKKYSCKLIKFIRSLNNLHRYGKSK